MRILPLVVLIIGVLAVIGSRVSHLDLVWIEEAYGMAAASELLRGKHLYTDIWFDKPPLYAWFYTLCAGRPGWALRLLDIGFVLACAASVFALARRLWDRATGMLGAALSCLALTFWFPSAVIAVAPDLLMIVPHALSVWAVASGRPLLAGALAGMALQCNSKAVIVLAVLLAWNWRQSARVLLGFSAVTALTLALLPVREYWQQVWWWGSRYSSDTFVQQPVREFVVRTAGWTAFHLAAALGTVFSFWRTRDWRMGLWLGLSFISVVAGLRFFPRYYFQLLPVVAVVGARGLMLMAPRWRLATLTLLLIPMLRFGPRYVQGATGWSDVAMMEDSRAASKLLGDGSLFVWGYRPDIYVFSGQAAGTRYLDSQPLTGVLADRHLVSSEPTFHDLASDNRRALTGTRPDYIVDGLGPLNPSLAIHHYPDLREWLSHYEEVGRTSMSIVLRRRPDGAALLEKR